MLADEIDAQEAQRIGLVNRVLPAAQWRESVDELVRRLADRFNYNSAEGKRVFYLQVASSSLESKYQLATDAMVGMFASAPFQAHMDGFLNRKGRPK